MQVFIPSLIICVLYLHHFQITLNQMYLIKARNKMNQCVFFFFLVLKKKSQIKYLFDLWKTFLLQSVVQSTSMFSSVPINVVSFFLLISANIVVWFLTKILTYCETQSLWLVLKNKFMLKPVICWLFHLYTVYYVSDNSLRPTSLLW